jgi:hypothetical protein
MEGKLVEVDLQGVEQQIYDLLPDPGITPFPLDPESS